MGYSFEEMLKYNMFKSVDEVKEFWETKSLETTAKRDKEIQAAKDIALKSRVSEFAVKG